MGLGDTHRLRIYLDGKPEGENSMFEKESGQAVGILWQKSCMPASASGLTDMVKAILPEPQSPWGLSLASRLSRL